MRRRKVTFLIARTTFFLFLGSLSTQLQAALGAQQWLILCISDDGDDGDDNDDNDDDGDDDDGDDGDLASS